MWYVVENYGMEDEIRWGPFKTKVEAAMFCPLGKVIYYQ